MRAANLFALGLAFLLGLLVAFLADSAIHAWRDGQGMLRESTCDDMRAALGRRQEAWTGDATDPELLERIDNLAAAWSDLCLYGQN